MSFEINGTLHKVFPTENKTDKFQAREFVIKIEEGMYPQYIKFQLTQDRCGLIDAYEAGQEIKVHFDLRGREWNEKYFTNLNAWRIEKGSNDQKPEPVSGPVSIPEEPLGSKPTTEIESDLQAEDFDDLPF
ncbi:MAG: DUF3127 domain-containing protein [Bacteroidota bacterium]